MLFSLLIFFFFINSYPHDGYYTYKKQLDCVLSSDNNINTPNKQGVFILNDSSNQYRITPDHDYYPKNINNQNDLLDNFAQNYLYGLGIKTDLDAITKRDLKFQTCALIVNVAYQKKQFIKNCLDNTKSLRIKIGDIIAKNSCEKAIKAAIHADSKEFESIVKVCNNMLSVAYAIGSEVCTNLWSKIQNSTLSSAAQITVGIAFCALAPGLMVGVAGAIGLIFASYNCWQKRDDLVKQLNHCAQAINDDNPERFGRELVKALDAGGELEIIYDAILFSTAHRIGSSLSTMLEAANFPKIKFYTKNLVNYAKIKPMTNKAKNTANKITDFIVEAVVEKTNKVIENAIITFEKTTGKSFSKTSTQKLVYIDSTDGTIHCNFLDPNNIKFNSKPFASTIDKAQIIRILKTSPSDSISLRQSDLHLIKTYHTNITEINKIKEFLKSTGACKEGSEYFMAKYIEGKVKSKALEYLPFEGAPCKVNMDVFHIICGEQDRLRLKGFHILDGLKQLPTSNVEIIKTKDLPGGAYIADIIIDGQRFRNKSIFPEMTFDEAIELGYTLSRKIDFKNPPIDPISGKIKQQFLSPSGLIVQIFINPKTYIIETLYPVEKFD